MEFNSPAIRKDIQILRGLSVLLVFIFHLEFSNFFGAGFIGVDVFFVISGYLTIPHLKQMHTFSSVVTYLARRIKRLFPASVMCLLLTFLALHFASPVRISRLVYEDLTAASLHYANIHLSAQSYFKTTAPSFVLHYWSLSLEEQYYFLVSAFIFLASKFFLYFFPSQASSDNDSDQASGSAPKFLHFLIYLTWFVSFCLCILTPESLIASKWKFFSVQFRFWEFLTGAILKLNESKLKLTSLSEAQSKSLWWCLFALLTILAFIIPFFGEVFTTKYPNIFTAIVVAVTFVLIMINNSKIQCRFLEFVGDSSYSIYLYHFPIIRLARLYRIESAFLEVLLISVFTFVLGMFSYYYVEKSSLWINKLMEGDYSFWNPPSTPKPDVLELPLNNANKERRASGSNTTTSWFLLYIIGSIMLALVISNASYASCGTSAYANLNPPPKMIPSIPVKDTTNPNNGTMEENDNNITEPSIVSGGSLGDSYGAWEDVFSDYDEFSARLMTEDILKDDFYSSVYEGNSWPWYQDKQSLFENDFPSKIFKYSEGNPKQCLLLIGDSHAMSWVPFMEYLAAHYNATLFLGVQSQGEVPGRTGPIPIHDRISMKPHEDFEQCTRGVLTFMAASNSVYMKNETALMYDWTTLARHWGPYGCFFGFEDVPGFGQIGGQCLVTSLERKKTNLTHCKKKRKDVTYWFTYNLLPMNIPNFYHIRIDDLFCDNTWCYMNAHEVPLYRDDGHHLSINGARWCAPKLHARIRHTKCFHNWN